MLTPIGVELLRVCTLSVSSEVMRVQEVDQRAGGRIEIVELVVGFKYLLICGHLVVIQNVLGLRTCAVNSMLKPLGTV